MVGGRSTMTGFAGYTFGIILTTGRNVIGRMTGQTGIWGAKTDPLLLEEWIIIGMSMGTA
jgi:hypothetical protein